MSTLSQDMQMRLSGGAANADPLKSLGGAMSSIQVSESLFDALSGAEAKTGRREQRLVYVYNNRATTLKNAVLYIKANTPNINTDVSVGLGVSGKNGTEPAISTDGAIPQGVTFLGPESYESGLVLGDIPGFQRFPVWISWFSAPNTAPDVNDVVTFHLDGSYEE